MVVYYHPTGTQSRPFTAENTSCEICLPQSLRSSAVQSAQFEAAWHMLRPVVGASNHPGSSLLWVRDFAAVFARDTALHAAFGAVALSRLGQQTRDTALVAQSYTAYEKALARFQVRLRARQSAMDDESLACIICFPLSEVGELNLYLNVTR